VILQTWQSGPNAEETALFTHLSIHHPQPGWRDALIASMHRYGAAIADAAGLVPVHTLADPEADVLVGLAIWESEDAFHASVDLARAAVAGDPFDEWEAEPVLGYRLTEVWR
jgi:heme-degrading monooxygenase HmoA